MRASKSCVVHGCRKRSIGVVAVFVYQGYNDSIERNVHHTIYRRITGDVRQKFRIVPLNTLSANCLISALLR